MPVLQAKLQTRSQFLNDPAKGNNSATHSNTHHGAACPGGPTAHNPFLKPYSVSHQRPAGALCNLLNSKTLATKNKRHDALSRDQAAQPRDKCNEAMCTGEDLQLDSVPSHTGLTAAHPSVRDNTVHPEEQCRMLSSVRTCDVELMALPSKQRVSLADFVVTPLGKSTEVLQA